MCIPRRLGIYAVFISLAMAVPSRAQQDVSALTQQAMTVFEEDKYDEALKLLIEADEKAPNEPFVLNFIGAVYSKKKDYAKADEYFKKALELQPDNFPARFNVGEIMFLQKKFTEAADYFEVMGTDYPKNELVRFKIFLCQLMLDKTDEAKRMLDKMKFPGETPAWYYSQAAWELKKKNGWKANDHRKAAELMFGKQTELYEESLKDSGLLK